MIVWTDYLEAELKAKYAHGETLEEIGAYYDRPIRSIRQKLMQLGVYKLQEPKPRPITMKEMKEQIAKKFDLDFGDKSLMSMRNLILLYGALRSRR